LSRADVSRFYNPQKFERKSMATTMTDRKVSIIAVYRDHESAEEAVRRLEADGIDMKNVSIIGKDFEAVERPVGFVTTGSVAKDGAKVGALSGGLFGLLVGAAFLVVPGIGPVIIAGPLAAALLGGVEGALGGAALGGLTGALVGLGVSKDKAIRYEADVKAGKYLVTLDGDAAQVQRTQFLLGVGQAESGQVI
jgi:tetrahydromethanopterin S-methyltransferase subunit G